MDAQNSDWPTAYCSIMFAKQIAQQYEKPHDGRPNLQVPFKKWQPEYGEQPTLLGLFNKLSPGGQTAVKR